MYTRTYIVLLWCCIRMCVQQCFKSGVGLVAFCSWTCQVKNKKKSFPGDGLHGVSRSIGPGESIFLPFLGWQRFRITKEAKQKPRPHVLEDALLLSLAKVRRGSQVPPAPEPNDECRQLRCRPEDEDFGACSCETWASSHVSSAQLEELRSRGEQADASAGRRAGVVDETAVSGCQLMLAPCFLRGSALKEHASCLCEFTSECDSCQWREPQLGIPYAIHRMRVWPSGTLNPKPLKSMTASMCNY